MHFTTPPRPKSEDDRILPLINVVFLLLIFFMLAGSLTGSDPFEIAPVKSASEASSGEKDIEILLGTESQVALDGAVMTQTDMITALTQRLKDQPDTMVRLKADGRIDATKIVVVMEKLREVGVSRLKLLTVPAPEVKVVQ